MAKKKQLSKKQLAVIDDLFTGELDEREVLEKHKVTRNIYTKWLADEEFGAEFARRIAGARLQSAALIARYSLMAAAKLVQLTESEKEETARKACLDIISLPQTAEKQSKQPENPQLALDKEVTCLSDQTASRILAALAEEKKEKELSED